MQDFCDIHPLPRDCKFRLIWTLGSLRHRREHKKLHLFNLLFSMLCPWWRCEGKSWVKIWCHIVAPNLKRKNSLKYPKKSSLYQKLKFYMIISFAKILSFCLFLHIFLRCFTMDLVHVISLCECYFFMKFSRSKYIHNNWSKYIYLENKENNFWCQFMAPNNAIPC